MANVYNTFEPNSINMHDQSTLNGDVHVYNNGKETKEADSQSIGSPLYLSSSATKIDLIRVMNAWYECGKVADKNGNKTTKKLFFEWVGKLFNEDLSNYDKNLSNAMATGNTYDANLNIFDELRDKTEEIYNSK